MTSDFAQLDEKCPRVGSRDPLGGVFSGLLIDRSEVGVGNLP
jgi:hypothetical protein